MEVAAAKATEEPREGSARQKLRKAASQTVRMGERKRSSTLWKKFGCFVECQFQSFGFDRRRNRGKRAYDSSISGEGEHHSGVRCQGEQPTVPHTNHNQTHQHHRSIISEPIHEDLEYRL
jgi:hypothetical protein